MAWSIRRVNGAREIVADDDFGPIATVHQRPEAPDSPVELDRHAKLIAAAPDMLAALQNAWLTHGAPPDGAWTEVRIAIAKATT